MFYHTTLNQNLYISPDLLSSNLDISIVKLLKETVEGFPFQDYGFIISVLNIVDIGEGQVLPDGNTVFCVRYQALTLKVNVGDVVDTVVTEVTNMGAFSSIGPITVFTSAYQMVKRSEKIEKNSLLRIKVLGVQVETEKIFVIGTVKEGYLGVIE